MKATKVIGLFAFILLASAFLVQPVSAGFGLTKFSYLENILQNADSYDIVWDGPAKGKSLYFEAHKDSSSALSGLDLNTQEFDTFSYERTNVNDRRSDNSGYGSYRNYRNSGSNSNYFRDTSERLYIDNTENNLGRHDVQRTAILTAGNSFNTYTLAQANVANTNTLANRDVQITDTLTVGQTIRAEIAAQRDIKLRNADVDAVEIRANRDVDLGRITARENVDRARISEDGDTERSRIFSDRDLGLARTTRDETRILTDRDTDSIRLHTERDIELAEISAFRDLARTDLIRNQRPRYNSNTGLYNWRY